MKLFVVMIVSLMVTNGIDAYWVLGSFINNSNIIFYDAWRLMSSGKRIKVDYLTDLIQSSLQGKSGGMRKTIRLEYPINAKGVALEGKLPTGEVVNLFIDNQEYMKARFSRPRNKSITDFVVESALQSVDECNARAVLKDSQGNQLSEPIAFVYNPKLARAEFDLYVTGANGRYVIQIQ